MGCHPNVDYERFPKQGGHLGRRATVLFNYGGPGIGGVCVRDDYEEPWLTIFHLDDGRYVTSGECQYQPVRPAAPTSGPAPGGPAKEKREP